MFTGEERGEGIPSRGTSLNREMHLNQMVWLNGLIVGQSGDLETGLERSIGTRVRRA